MAIGNALQSFETHFVDAAKGWFVLFKDYNALEPRQV